MSSRDRVAAPAEMGSQGAPSKGVLLAVGRAIGTQEVQGRGRYVHGRADFQAFSPGEILLADDLAEEWPEALGGAAAIVLKCGESDRAVAAAKRLGVPVILSAADVVSPLWTGAPLAICCDERGRGAIFEVSPDVSN